MVSVAIHAAPSFIGIAANELTSSTPSLRRTRWSPVHATPRTASASTGPATARSSLSNRTDSTERPRTSSCVWP
jgi:hypothetical protein